MGVLVLFSPSLSVRQALSAFAKAFPSGKIKSKKRRHDEGTDASAHKKLTRASVLPSPAGPVPTAAVASPYVRARAGCFRGLWVGR
jgi:hypothetical protein